MVVLAIKKLRRISFYILYNFVDHVIVYIIIYVYYLICKVFMFII